MYAPPGIPVFLSCVHLIAAASQSSQLAPADLVPQGGLPNREHKISRFQSKALRMIVDEPWHVPNMVIQRDLKILTVKEEIRCYSSQYSACLSVHPNDLIVNFMEQPDNRRL
jgi:hypothetical protein